VYRPLRSADCGSQILNEAIQGASGEDTIFIEDDQRFIRSKMLSYRIQDGGHERKRLPTKGHEHLAGELGSRNGSAFGLKVPHRQIHGT